MNLDKIWNSLRIIQKINGYLSVYSLPECLVPDYLYTVYEGSIIIFLESVQLYSSEKIAWKVLTHLGIGYTIIPPSNFIFHEQP